MVTSPSDARGADGGLVAGILAGTLLAYAYQLVGGRLLGPEGFAPVSVLWTLMFLGATIGLTPVEQLIVRESTAGRRVLTRRSWALGAAFALTAAAMTGFTFATRETLFQGSGAFVAQALLMSLVLAPVIAARGLVMGHRRYGHYGLMLGLEGVGRLAVGVAGYLLVGGAVGFGWGLAFGPLFVLLVPTLHLERHATNDRAGGDAAFLAPYLGAGAASQLLLAGAPIAVAALGADAATISIVFVTFTLFRAPVTIVYLVQGRILNLLVRLEIARDHAALLRVRRSIELVGIVAVASAGAVGWLVGPAVVGLLYGDAFRPTAAVAALAATGVAGAAAAQLLGQLLVARGQTARLAGRWAIGLAAALVTLVLVPGDAALAVASAFAVGEIVAAAAMAQGARSRTGVGSVHSTGDTTV